MIATLGIGAVAALSLVLTGCADSDLENANLRIENTKMCAEMGEMKHEMLIAGSEQNPPAEEYRTVVYNEKCLLYWKKNYLDGLSTHRIVIDLESNKRILDFIVYSDGEVNGIESEKEGMSRIKEYGFPSDWPDYK